ncbi:MAG TPA: hypothetical protein VF062_05935 [Candidatus Limnocylindrales bacterium]
MRDQEPMLDVARGNKAVSEHLRESLKNMRDDSGDKDFRRLIDDVLSGELSLREAAMMDLFERGISESLDETVRQYEQLSESERDRLADEGEAELKRRNAEIEEQERFMGTLE